MRHFVGRHRARQRYGRYCMGDGDRGLGVKNVPAQLVTLREVLHHGFGPVVEGPGGRRVGEIEIDLDVLETSFLPGLERAGCVAFGQDGSIRVPYLDVRYPFVVGGRDVTGHVVVVSLEVEGHRLVDDDVAVLLHIDGRVKVVDAPVLGLRHGHGPGAKDQESDERREKREAQR